MTTTNPAERIARRLTNQRHRDKRPATLAPTEVRAHANDDDIPGQIIASGDPYVALLAATTTTPPRYLSVTTSGWAAPNTPDDNTPPSLHPKRQRVSLALVVDCQTYALTSALRMATDRATTIGNGEQSGAVADAAIETARRLTNN